MCYTGYESVYVSVTYSPSRTMREHASTGVYGCSRTMCCNGTRDRLGILIPVERDDTSVALF